MTITADQMSDSLMSLDDVREKLAATEPLSTRSFSVGSDIWFELDPEWNYDHENIGDDEPVKAVVKVNGSEFRLTKDTLLEVASTTGLSKGYVCRAPAKFIGMQLNYWYRGGLGEGEYKFLATDDTAFAMTRQSLQPFSNLRLLDQAVDSIQDKYGKDAAILADKKFNHSLRGTHLRLVVPENSRVIERTGTEDDTWSLGVQIRNSLIGEGQTSVDGYLFRWWCKNGAIDTHATSGTWSRRGGQGQGDEVYAWAKSSIDEILGGLEHSFDAVQSLVDLHVEDEAVAVLRDIFEQYKIPRPQRDSIIAEMVEQTSLNMYSVMQAVTQVANNADLSPAHVERLMRVGGDLVYSSHQRCDACRRLLPGS